MRLFLVLLTLISFTMTSENASANNAYNFTFEHIDAEKPLSLADYKGKVILVVNTACMCSFTPQFEGLEQLYNKYKDQGLVIIGVPSNDFGGQEFDTEKEVQDYTQKNFKLTFPLARITKVRGDEAHPFYKWAGEKAGMIAKPKWNFHKYLIAKNGKFIDWFASTTSPDSKKLSGAIEKELQK